MQNRDIARYISERKTDGYRLLYKFPCAYLYGRELQRDPHMELLFIHDSLPPMLVKIKGDVIREYAQTREFIQSQNTVYLSEP